MATKETAQGCLVLIVGAGLLVVGVRACFGGDDKSEPEAKLGADVKPEAMAAPIPLEERAADRRDAAERGQSAQCVVSMPGNAGEVPVLPTEKGYDEFTSAIAQTADGRARDVVFRANGGFWVTKGTRCVVVDLGLTASEVRLVDGAHVGKTGWLPNEWRRGE